jgi:hypothetical protein
MDEVPQCFICCYIRNTRHPHILCLRLWTLITSPRLLVFGLFFMIHSTILRNAPSTFFTFTPQLLGLSVQARSHPNTYSPSACMYSYQELIPYFMCAAFHDWQGFAKLLAIYLARWNFFQRPKTLEPTTTYHYALPRWRRPLILNYLYFSIDEKLELVSLRACPHHLITIKHS